MRPKQKGGEMTLFLLGLIIGGFLGAFVANKTFRDKVTTQIKKWVKEGK